MKVSCAQPAPGPVINGNAHAPPVGMGWNSR